MAWTDGRVTAMTRTLLTLTLIATIACAKKREPAPAEMEELARFMLRVWDDDASLEGAMDNLAPWLEQNMTAEDAQDGYRLGVLLEGDVEFLEHPDRPLDGLLGAAVAGISRFPIRDHALSMVLGEQVFSNPGTYDFYLRDVQGDADAFVNGEGTITTVNDIQTSTLGVTIPYILNKDYKWVRGRDSKPAIIGRSWIPEKGCNQGGENCLELSFSIDIFYENSSSETGRFTATWSEVKSPFTAFLTETQLVASLANGMANVFTDVDHFLTEGGVD